MKLDTPNVQFQLKDHVLIATFKKGLEIHLKMARQIVRDRIRFTESRPLPVLIRNQGVVSMTKDATHYFFSKKGTQLLKAVAFVDSSTFGEGMIRFFMLLKTPPMPVRVFSEEPMAWDWLDEFIDND